ncbi:MAG: YegS/Rv2252/BmrU family lipid kinase [Fulvivirga sp.]|nr:YegS/Rv2252/BmrU family lipid kinase [Fulvivirga sp.]
MRKLLFIINPISGGINKSGLRKSISRCCGQEGIEYTFMETCGNEDDLLIKNKIEDYQPTAVIACGGDGTVNLVAQQLHGREISLGIMPLGSANGLATELDIPEEINKALRVIVENKVIKMDILQINDQHICLHLSDIGFNAKLIKRFEKSSYRGKLGYATHFFETLIKKKQLLYKFEYEEETFDQKAEMVVFANARKYGTGAIVNPIGKVNDRKFEVCIFKPYPWYAIFRLAYLFFIGKLNYSPFVKIFSTRSVTVSSDKSEHLQIDGESIGKFKRVVVKLSEHQLPVIVPQAWS